MFILLLLQLNRITAILAYEKLRNHLFRTRAYLYCFISSIKYITLFWDYRTTQQKIAIKICKHKAKSNWQQHQAIASRFDSCLKSLY